MKPFETFLESLSLHQLRQCAATVNSVLVRREGNTGSQGPSSTAAAAAVSAQSSVAATGSAQASEATTGSAFSLLREWLPASTADSVIAALQTAQLDAGTTATTPAAAATTTVDAGNNNGSGSGSTGGAEADEQASEPRVETGSDGTPWLSFVYAQKGKTRRHRIRIDMERAALAVIPSSFRTNNCVYPRANCTRQAYGGNRWGYETECNVLGWRLAFLNQELLASRRGLLQAAVNSYRAAVAGRKSRRIARLEKATPAKRPATAAASGSAAEKRPRTALPSPATAQGAKSLVVPLSAGRRMRISVEVGALEAAAVDETFRREHAVFPRALSAGQSRYGAQMGRWTFEVVCNELAWRLAWLNRSRLRGRRLLIQLCLDAYRGRFAAPPWPLLECYRDQMAGDVEPGFFDYWRPRSQRKQRPPPATDHRAPDSALPIPALPAAASALPVAAPATPTRKPAARPATAPRAQPASVPQTSAVQSRSTSTPASSGVSAPQRPRTPAPVRPSTTEQPSSARPTNPRSVRPHPLPVAATDGRPPPSMQRPKNVALSNRPPRQPAKPPVHVQQRTGALPPSMPSRPSTGSATRPQLPSRAPRPPAPMRTRPPVSAAVTTPTSAPSSSSTPAPASPQPKSEGRAAKAQVAADMLTDVLRRLAGSDPSLERLLAAQGDAASAVGLQKSTLRAGGDATQDDGVLLDAKVAELEKLIAEMQRN
ncbi:hypothetical protein H4R20_002501 [Coemansia guatemalensis]|uniref:DUF8032 domain-containing protein n=1 Tax=Coemansia guatemalensis TaxID=2761395 RepID=A0A9W8I2D0_9FUNG|nr:hypothetical protein H4R20_002501 [Coemansia guatemalensis]